MKHYIEKEITKTLQALQLVAGDAEIATTVEKIAMTCCRALRSGKKILLAGNGGSAADAQHLAAELVGRLNFDRPGLAAIALTTDTSVLTAVGNDYGYERVFARQVQALGTPGDVLIAMSTSGTSRNIVLALEEARRLGLITVGLTGQSRGDMPPCDYLLRAPTSEAARIQEIHIVLGHVVCSLIESAMFSGK
jgi:D-sedoheptulose 7-phosphate isomerase